MSERHSTTVKHPPTCLCEVCEQTDSGEQAERAFCSGDEKALGRLSVRVRLALPALVTLNRSASEAA